MKINLDQENQKNLLFLESVTTPTETKYRPLVIAVDFDKTIDTGNWPDIGQLQPDVKEVLNKWQKQGIYVIIWTCRNSRWQMEAELFLKQNQIPFDKINEQCPWAQLEFGTENGSTRKIWSDILIDDTSLDWVLNGHPGWEKIDKNVQTIINRNICKYTVLPENEL